MSTCPACGAEVDVAAAACPTCHLAVSLFPAVHEAAGSADGGDPTYLRTIGELLATVDLAGPTPAATGPGPLHRRSALHALPPADLAAPPTHQRDAETLGPLRDLPALPSLPATADVRRRVDDYFQVGRRLGLDFTDFESRANAARLVDDSDSLEVLSREMFVHLASALAEEYESTLALRNELAQLVPTRSADVEFEAIRRAIAAGDVAGAQRRLAHVRDELGRVEEEWQVGRILVTECELLATTARELGGDPALATGPLEEGRRLIALGRRAEGERLLARATVAMWAVLQPRILEDLHRLRDRLVELRTAAMDVAPAVSELRNVATELRQRNFVGTIVAYRRLRALVDRTQTPGEESLAVPSPSVEMKPAPSA